ncbi:ABC transporter ATP-binding protein [bacterium]|nr:ABC transporter ATP-binding protein [bacterium]
MNNIISLENPPEMLLEVKNLKKYFEKNHGLIDTLLGKTEYVKAVDQVRFSIRKGETLCLVGESGCGKTTIAKILLGLLQATEGEILYKGEDLTKCVPKRFKELRTKIQMIFQDPYASLDPRATVYDSVAEPLEVNGLTHNKHEKVMAALELAKLLPVEKYLYKYPHQLSGGERQRVGVATALVMNPDFVIADEPTSMLDVSVQANLLSLLQDLKRKNNLTMLFITHNLSVAYVFGDRLAIMYLGRIVEMGTTEIIKNEPLHPYTKALFSVVPRLHPDGHGKTILEGDIPDASHIPSGCPFHPRCPEAQERCQTIVPELEEIGNERQVACILVSKMIPV